MNLLEMILNPDAGQVLAEYDDRIRIYVKVSETQYDSGVAENYPVGTLALVFPFLEDNPITVKADGKASFCEGGWHKDARDKHWVDITAAQSYLRRFMSSHFNTLTYAGLNSLRKGLILKNSPEGAAKDIIDRHDKEILEDLKRKEESYK